MSPQLSDPGASSSGTRKAAIFLLGIGNERSAQILRQLNPEEVQRISAEITSLGSVAPDDMMQVFKEFEKLSASSRYFAVGGPESARRLIGNATGTEGAGPTGSSPFRDTDPQELAKVLREENPQTLALVLSNLAPEQAGPLMASLPVEVQPEVALRIALIDRIAPEVFGRIAQAIQTKLKVSKQLTRSNGSLALASILNSLDGEFSDRVLNAMETDNMQVAESVRKLMFVFEDIIDIDKNGMTLLISNLDRKILTLALKGATDKMKLQFTQTMSQRSSDMLTEDMEALGPVRIGDVTDARQQIITAVGTLKREGTISIGRAGTDEYVV